MQIHTKVVVALVLIGSLSIAAYRFIAPLFEESAQKQSSDARDIKAKIIIGTDNWIGYFPLCSPHLRKSMRNEGYDLRCQDDRADYLKRMQALNQGEVQFAVATVDSYLVNGAAVNYPATIVAVIDESKGGDAVVAWADKIKNIDALKSNESYRIALTPSSPSEHLLRSMAVHFDIPKLKPKSGRWRVEANGSEDALRLLLQKKVDVAVLWEPDVQKALQQDGVSKILGTEDTEKLIVDILLVNRKYSQKNPEIVSALLRTYFHTVKFYRDNQTQLANDVALSFKLDKKNIASMLQGVDWKSLTDNSLSWFGAVPQSGNQVKQGLIDTIESTAQVLIDLGDYSLNAIPDHDPYRLVNSQFVSELYQASAVTQFGQSAGGKNTSETGSLALEFASLGPAQWDALREVGTLKIRPIVFQSGTSDLTEEGKNQISQAVENLKHYPKFRILVKGHSGTGGDVDANLALSEQRAKSVAQYLHDQYGIDADRLRPVGYGSKQLLSKLAGESERAYQYRLPRVELFLMAEDF